MVAEFIEARTQLESLRHPVFAIFPNSGIYAIVGSDPFSPHPDTIITF